MILDYNNTSMNGKSILYHVSKALIVEYRLFAAK